MKSKTLALATLLLATAFLLTQTIAPHTALAGNTLSWSNTGGGVSSYEITSLACDAVHNVLYAGTEGQGVWEYNGTTWTNTGGGFSEKDGPINSLAYDSVHNLLYMSGYGVWKYDGTAWTNTGGELKGWSVESLAYDSVHNLLYAGTDGVWKYDGTAWTPADEGLWSNGLNYAGVDSLAFDSADNVLYAGTWSFGVWKYNGVKWTDTGGKVSKYDIYSLAYDSSRKVLYAGCDINSADRGYGVWRYDGTAWTYTGGGVSKYKVSSLAWDPVHKVLYAGSFDIQGGVWTGHGVWKYDGAAWTNTGGGVSSDEIGSLAYDSGQNVLYAGTARNGVWKYAYNPPVPPPGQWKSAFYFAEGYTGVNFQEYATLENPDATAADSWITCMFTDGTSKSQYYSLAPTSRLTVDINQLAGAGKEQSMRVVSTSPGIVAERPMYFNYLGQWSGGSDAMGANSPSKDWYFAEGNTLSNFDQYITVLNPGNASANLTFHYMVEGQGEKAVSGSVPANSRATFKTRDQIGSNLNASLYVSSNQPVVAERPMYFDYNNWTGGHDVVGANAPDKAWYFAEGTTRDNFNEWLCLQNPGDSDITIKARYMLGAGQGDPTIRSYTVPAKERLTVSVNKEIGLNKDNSVQLTSDDDFIAERPMYFSYNGWTGGHDVLGANSLSTSWNFAEGTTRDNFNEWLCLQNPGSKDAHATITYYTTSGQAIKKSWTISANSRLTVNVNQDAGANLDISTKVTSENPIIVERPMYFDYNGWTGGHDVVGFVPSP